MTQNPVYALITGCSSGIGKQLALEFAARGVIVLATARNTRSLDDLTSRHKNIEAIPLVLDDPKSIEKLKDVVAERTNNSLDFLVNNAGTHYAATAIDLDLTEVTKLFQVNVFAIMHLCQIFSPLLRRSHHRKIVQIGSVTRDVPMVWQCAYNASKAALSQYTKTLRLELQPFGVEVIEVVTGFVRSNILHHGLHAPEGSPYLAIKDVIEDFKYRGNANGMPTETYARSVVSKLMKSKTNPEIWEGALAWTLWALVTLLPRKLLHILVFYKFKLSRLTIIRNATTKEDALITSTKSP
ncbi:1-acyl dihydroxyacetone phosphate reductase [Truncatella angustata]|uniref:1-acyl dihydroxyacetone phosphate reductase n=1 Tax=Truncatella angustata TaxID=152316 RepID=A0A9P8UTU5_9PEZI|nr:1-acyl dihydroxyacetone phosphate reductase [Truncatella angustata]KAH6658243.1 1-acyl dihydroxyacetone phosphate reductase [Truncatella angustata]